MCQWSLTSVKQPVSTLETVVFRSLHHYRPCFAAWIIHTWSLTGQSNISINLSRYEDQLFHLIPSIPIKRLNEMLRMQIEKIKTFNRVRNYFRLSKNKDRRECLLTCPDKNSIKKFTATFFANVLLNGTIQFFAISIKNYLYTRCWCLCKYIGQEKNCSNYANRMTDNNLISIWCCFLWQSTCKNIYATITVQ